MKELLSRPLILGASVSADFASLSPGKRLALRYTSAEAIAVHARGGRTGAETMASVPPRLFQNRTAVIAIDAFFWDSGLPSPVASLAALRGLLTRAREAGAALVLGDIPEILPGLQPSRVALNHAIHAAAREWRRVRVLPLDAMFTQLRRTGSLLIEGRRRSWRELAPDGLHIGEEACEFLADRIGDLLAGVSVAASGGSGPHKEA